MYMNVFSLATLKRQAVTETTTLISTETTTLTINQQRTFGSSFHDFSCGQQGWVDFWEGHCHSIWSFQMKEELISYLYGWTHATVA